MTKVLLDYLPLVSTSLRYDWVIFWSYVRGDGGNVRVCSLKRAAKRPRKAAYTSCDIFLGTSYNFGMYVVAVSLLMFIFPVASVLIELIANRNPAGLVLLIGKWFVFWAIGVRLFTAGLRQSIKPGLTSEGILGIKGKEVWIIVRELGFANIAIGLAGIIALWKPEWRLAVAFIGGLFLLLDGGQHIASRQRKFEENVAMYSDLVIGFIMAIYVITNI
jgi:hypothetical protein